MTHIRVSHLQRTSEGMKKSSYKICKSMTDNEKLFYYVNYHLGEHENIVNLYNLKKLVKFCFQETFELLSKIFSDKSSLVNTRWECWNVVKKEEDFVTYARTAN